ncbi:unnamed protein product, partial [Closterium sp. Yama58-4]
MRASPAGILLLALALICAASLSAAAVEIITAAYDDDTVKSVTHRSMLSSSSSGSATSGSASVVATEVEVGAVKSVTHRSMLAASTSGSASVVATEVDVGTSRLSFSAKRCVSVPKKAMRSNVTVWWKGSDPSSSAGGASSSPGSGSAAKGVQCAQVKFFGKAGCKGKAVDNAVNPRTAGMLLFPSSEKTVSKWASVASVLCDTVDRACDALGCEPDGTCVKDQNGERYCQWDSPCGSCPTGATCKTVPSKGSIVVQVPYCECPSGYGMTATECVAGGKDTVGGNSYTFIANPAAKDYTSRPYTLRYNVDGCTQFPAAVAGKYTAKYTVYSVKSNAYCYKYQEFSTDNCEGNPDSQLFSLEKRLDTKVQLNMQSPGYTRSVKCFTVQLMKTAYGDDTVKSMSQGTALRIMLNAAYGAGEETVAEATTRKVNARVAQETSGVTTTVLLGTARLSFSRQRCVSVPKKAGRKSVKVWWNGRGGSSNVGSGGGATGVACSQVKLFGKRGCQGKAVDSMVNPETSDA